MVRTIRFSTPALEELVTAESTEGERALALRARENDWSPQMRLSLSIVALVIAQMLVFDLAKAEDVGAPNQLSVKGVTEKVCQLTGDVDWETGKPTAARTLSNFGLDAVDLGYPVELGGKLILLFGDTWPPRHGGGGAGEIPPDDAVGVTLRVAPPNETDHGRAGTVYAGQQPQNSKNSAIV